MQPGDIEERFSATCPAVCTPQEETHEVFRHEVCAPGEEEAEGESGITARGSYDLHSKRHRKNGDFASKVPMCPASAMIEELPTFHHKQCHRDEEDAQETELGSILDQDAQLYRAQQFSHQLNSQRRRESCLIGHRSTENIPEEVVAAGRGNVERLVQRSRARPSALTSFAMPVVCGLVILFFS